MRVDLAEVDAWSVQDAYARSMIHRTWERLPSHVRQALRGLRFTEDVAGLAARKAYASAGDFDVTIRDFGIVSEQAAIGIIAHEIGHVAGQDFRRLRAGEITEQQAEHSADAYARAWGFGSELEQRKFFLGK
jgi:hypothetical protein